MIIIGAGIAGIMARSYFASLHPQIYEARSNSNSEHKAIMRFRDSSVGYLLGVPLEKVQVSKAIYYHGHFVEPNPAMSNLYSRKVSQGIYHRSIQSILPVERFIAKSSIHASGVLLNKTLERVEPYTCYFSDGTSTSYDVCISTIPLPFMAKAAGLKADAIKAQYFPISVTRYRANLPADVYQTVYFPDLELSIYRASLEGQNFIVESQGECRLHAKDKEALWEAFGLSDEDLEEVDCGVQQMGKIVEMEDIARRQIIMELTNKFKIYSLGRYAIWKNITTDILVKDLHAIAKMMYYDSYQIKLEAMK